MTLVVTVGAAVLFERNERYASVTQGEQNAYGRHRRLSAAGGWMRSLDH